MRMLAYVALAHVSIVHFAPAPRRNHHAWIDFTRLAIFIYTNRNYFYFI